MSNTPKRLIDLVQFNEKNTRKISKSDLEKLKASIREFPEMLEKRPVVYDENMVSLGGNQRLKALRELDKEGFVVKDEYFQSAAGWSDEQKRQFVVKDNVSNGEWDTTMLFEQYEVDELKQWGLDLPEMKKLGEDTNEDEPPAVSAEEPVSKLGEVYQLGRHRLMCGDSLENDNVMKLMGDHLADMVFTDPPYNVYYTGKTKESLKIENDKKNDGEFFSFLLQSFTTLAEFVKSGAAIYVCHSDSEGLNFRRAFQEAGFLLKQCIIWNKNSMVMGRQDYQWKHEPILYGWKDGGAHAWYGSRSETTVWDIDRPSRSTEHPTMKPIALIAKALHNSSKSGDLIVDLFAGSGSTLITCEQIDRTCFTMELDPKYCDVIRKRWHTLVSGDVDGWVEATPVLSDI